MTIVELSTRMNPIVTPILRSRLHWLLSPGLMLLTVRGRKTGRRYTIPVGYHKMEDAIIVLVGDAPQKVWWRNYIEPGPIEARLRRREISATAVVLRREEPEYRRRIEASFRRSPLIAWLFGMRLDRDAGLSDAQLEQFARQAVVVMIRTE